MRKEFCRPECLLCSPDQNKADNYLESGDNIYHQPPFCDYTAYILTELKIDAPDETAIKNAHLLLSIMLKNPIDWLRKSKYSVIPARKTLANTQFDIDDSNIKPKIFEIIQSIQNSAKEFEGIDLYLSTYGSSGHCTADGTIKNTGARKTIDGKDPASRIPLFRPVENHNKTNRLSIINDIADKSITKLPGYVSGISQSRKSN
jgi:hypothetical protein